LDSSEERGEELKDLAAIVYKTQEDPTILLASMIQAKVPRRP
jgi:hypothetical protein